MMTTTDYKIRVNEFDGNANNKEIYMDVKTEDFEFSTVYKWMYMAQDVSMNSFTIYFKKSDRYKTYDILDLNKIPKKYDDIISKFELLYQLMK